MSLLMGEVRRRWGPEQSKPHLNTQQVLPFRVREGVSNAGAINKEIAFN